MMVTDATDVSGVCIENIVFDTEGKERAPWPSPCGSKVPRTAFVFIAQICLIFLIVIFCIVQLSRAHISCEESTIHITILSSSVAYILPPPHSQ